MCRGVGCVPTRSSLWSCRARGTTGHGPFHPVQSKDVFFISPLPSWNVPVTQTLTSAASDRALTQEDTPSSLEPVSWS